MSTSPSPVAALRPFVPARDFARSRQFYLDLGFTLERDGPELAVLALDAQAILLQNFHVQAWADNCVLQLVVDDLDAWWRHIEALDPVARHGTKAPVAPERQPWGLTIAFLFDPSGVLWHIVQREPAPGARA
jgi:catechol 2,3-dioxygenase-like lactoylglutathione lyase family enzyme